MPLIEAVRGVGLPALLVTLGVLPVFLLSSLAVFVRAQLGFSEALLGVSIAANFGAAAVASAPAGRLTQRLGARVGFATGCGLVGIGLVGVALTGSWLQLTAWLVVAGFGNAFMQVAANLRIARTVAATSQGLAFGMKQSAIPAATLLAGVAVPAIGMTLGWRAAFALAALMLASVAVVLWLSADVAVPVVSSSRPAFSLPIMVLTVGIAFAAGTATNLSTFLVEFAATVGWDVSHAGILLAVASACCVIARLVVGRRIDRRGGDGLRIVTLQLALGAPALALLGRAGTWPLALAVTALLGFVFGWGWSGVFNHAIVSRSGDVPAAVTGITQAGIYAGGGLGPLLFGITVTAVGYQAAWTLTALGMATAAALIATGRRLAGSGALAVG